MVAFDPQHLAADCGGTWRGTPVVPVTGFSIDTRTLRAGEMFVALRTEQRDGHEFVVEAAHRGASGAVVSSPLTSLEFAQLRVTDTLRAFQSVAAAHRRRFPGAVVGVTGSAGKTSTKDLLAAILAEPDEVLATEGNLNNHLGVPLTLTRLDPERHRFAVVEAGISSPGEMDVVASMIAPDVALITTVAPAHLEHLGSVDAVSVEKARLAGFMRSKGVAVFPSVCLEYRAFRSLAEPAHVAVPAGSSTQGFPAGANPVPYGVRHEGETTSICLTWGGAVEEFDTRRLTSGMAANAVLAIITAFHLGATADAIRERLVRWRPRPLRGEVRLIQGRVFYLDCYNANPASMLDALEGFLAVAPAAHSRLYVVGSMEELGSEAADLHRLVGRQWSMGAGDRLVVFGTHAGAFAEGVRETAAGADILIDPDRETAMRVIRESRGPVFVKGSRQYRLETLIPENGGMSDHVEEKAG